jgi:transcriptional regulator with XRE-family HTH domain
MEKLAERLAWAREKKGFTQAGLAKAAKVSQSTIGNLEAEIRQTSRKIAVIASVLGVDVLWLAEGVGRPHKNDPEHAPQLAAKAANDESVSGDEIVELINAYKGASLTDRHLILSSAKAAALKAARRRGEAAVK